VIMQSLSIYNNSSPLLILKARMVEYLDNFANKIKDWLINDMIHDFENRKLYFSGELDKSKEFSASIAKSKLAALKRTIELLEKLDKSVSNIHDSNLISNFKSFKQVVYKFEARLHRIAVSENPIIETPEDLKAQISGMGLNPINKQLYPDNALS